MSNNIGAYPDDICAFGGPEYWLKQIDLLNDKISILEKEKQKIYQTLSVYKKKIEKENHFLIGKRAICINEDNPRPVECVCTGVMALDDYSSVKPLFSRNGKKYIIESYEWID
jgi:hypothetical protein